MKRINVLILTSVIVTAAIARAQPPPVQDPVGPGSAAGSDGSGSAAQIGSNGTTTDVPLTMPPDTPPVDPYANQPGVETPKKKVTPHGPINMPEVLTTPTGWLLPAAVIYSRTSIDTGGGVTSDNRVGLGDVAEFGLATTDAVRERDNGADKSVDRIQPYVTASFRLGVGEDRLFEGQPGMTLGFRKSFERNHDDFKTRIAELTFVMSKHLGKNAAIHVGGAFWDASLEGQLDDGSDTRRELTFHDGPTRNQLRAFGGIEVRPLPRSQILVDLGWSPEFCYHCTD
ncbi:MAG: hypothetical protein ABI175_12765, partial [Polyangiales bacterium]